ncbi:hypothetical protein [Picosynechococcus sp. PCC 73109]|uniref:hypothetical protein n=1 Tax=Picosynechococcus sp. PCC 73109 TaxID=374982 RepID=UPI000B0CF52B|nr:hypothetical protein [Picosynechococcus sp. PCC 73109]
MASLEKKWHVVQLDGENAKIWLPDVYDGIGSAVGITEITPEQAADITNSMGVSEGLKDGQLVRLRLTVRDATTGRSKSARVLCSVTEVRTAISRLPGLTYRGNAVRSAGVPRRRRLG